MNGQRDWVVTVVAIVTLLFLAGCTVEEPVLPDRPIDVSLESAIAAQEAAIGGALASGEISLTEEQVSSILTFLAQQNSGDYNVVDEINVWFEENGAFIAQIALLEGTLPDSFSTDDIIIEGTIEDAMVEAALHNNSGLHRFGHAAVIAQGESDAEDASEEKADEAEEAAEETADEIERAAREKEDELEEKGDEAEAQLRQQFAVKVEEINVGGVSLPDETSSMIGEQMGFAVSFLEQWFSGVSTAAGEINITL